jgi:CRISPR system Cascade subunit CasE
MTGWQLLVQSQIHPNWETLPKDYLLHAAENPGTKCIADAFKSVMPGKAYSFRLRANPTRKIDTKRGPSGEKQNGRRVPHSRTEDQIQWLLRKSASHGFALQQVVIAASGSSELVSSQHGNLCFQGVTFEGALVVVDKEILLDTLRNGIGSGKAFGFGLLSLAPSQKSN